MQEEISRVMEDILRKSLIGNSKSFDTSNNNVR